MATIKWQETIPSITSAVGSFPRYAQSVWTSISAGMSTEHYWDGSGGASTASRGALLPGGTRCFFDVRSNSSTPTSQATATLYLTSDTTRLLAYDSSGTYQVGTPFLSEFSSGSITTGYYVRQSGSFFTSSNIDNRNASIVFPVPFLVAPTIVHVTPSNHSVAANAQIISTSGFSSAISTLNSASQSAVTLFWEALGIVSSASY